MAARWLTIEERTAKKGKAMNFRPTRSSDAPAPQVAAGLDRSDIAAHAIFVLLALIALAGCSGPAADSNAAPAGASGPTATDIAARGKEESSGAVDRPGAAVSDMDGEDLAAIVEAAVAFTDLLDAQQRSAALLPIDSDKRSNWSNRPAGSVSFDRNGVRIGDLTSEQAAAMFAFLSTALSEEGYETVMAVVAAEGILAQGARAGRLGWSEENYWLAFFGAPGETDAWAWQFGGHHLAVNMSISGGRVTMSPTFVGIEPAVYDREGGGSVEPFAEEIAGGLALVNGLAGSAQEAAIISRRPAGVITGAGQDGLIPRLEGSQVVGWSSAQQQSLLDLISLWVGMLPARSAGIRMAEIASHLKDTYFAWHGSTDGAGAMYYRIQGPTLIIEFSTEGALGADGGHYHSIYRDPTNEYGQR